MTRLRHGAEPSSRPQGRREAPVWEPGLARCQTQNMAELHPQSFAAGRHPASPPTNERAKAVAFKRNPQKAPEQPILLYTKQKDLRSHRDTNQYEQASSSPSFHLGSHSYARRKEAKRDENSARTFRSEGVPSPRTCRAARNCCQRIDSGKKARLGTFALAPLGSLIPAASLLPPMIKSIHY